MDWSTFSSLAMVCAPLVHPTTAHALVSVESGFNPHAIGVVGGQLLRQPQSLPEALATTFRLETSGLDFSVGLAQINRRNWAGTGLNAQNAFDPCANLQAMQAILMACFERAAGDAAPQQALRLALSCYYSGNFATGFQHGYVARVIRAANVARHEARAPP